MILEVVGFMFGICAMSFMMSIPLLAINNSLVACFSVVFMLCLLCWLMADNVRLHNELKGNFYVAPEVARLNQIIRELKIELDLAEKENAFIKVKYNLLKSEQWTIHKSLGGVSCMF